MTSSSSVGQTRITLQFGLDRDIDGAARDVQAAINAARADLPTSLRSNPDLPQGQSRRRADPDPGADLRHADAAARSTTPPPPSCSRSCRRSTGVGQVDDRRQLAAGGAGRAQPDGAVQVRHRPGGRARRAGRRPTPTAPRARSRTARSAGRSTPTTRRRKAADYRPLVVAYRNGAAVRLSDVADVVDSVENLRNAGLANGKPAVLVILYPPAGRQHHRHGRPRQGGCCRSCKASMPRDIDMTVGDRPHAPRSAPRCTTSSARC